MSKYSSDLSVILQALADPTRRAIIERLARGPASVSELALPFGMALPSIVAHLHKLEAAGLITSEKDGRVRTCALQPQALAPVHDWLQDQRVLWDSRLDRLETYLQTLTKEPNDADRP